MLGGFGIYVTGHRHPKVLKAVKEQLDRQAIHSQELIDPLRTYLAHLVAMITPGDLQYSFFTNSGTESIEACLKMAILTTGRHHFVGTIGAFHGKSLGSLGGTSKAVFREPFLPLKRWTHVPFGDVDALRMIVASGDFSGDKVAAVVIEPIQGEGGINVAPPGYLAAAREICDKYGAVLVFDEVQSGMGRSGKMFCCEHDGVVPDLMALGKGFGGGVMPIGACVGHAEDLGALHRQPVPAHDDLRRQSRLLRGRDRDDQRAPRGGPAEAGGREGRVPAAADERARQQVPEGHEGRAGPRAHARHGVPDHDLGYAVAKALFGRGILISGTYINAQVLRVEPPLVITYPELDRFLAALEASLQDVSAQECHRGRGSSQPASSRAMLEGPRCAR